MRGYGLDFNPTRDFVLAHVSQEQIMTYYLGVEVQLHSQFRSPLRADNNPTCGFAYTARGKLMFRDFAGHFWGDCFDVACHVRCCSFKDVLPIIVRDFNLINNTTRHSDLSDSPKPRKLFEYSIRHKWSELDKDYWLGHKIHSKTLQKFHVSPVHIAWIDKKIVYRYNPSDPCYAYFVKMGKDGIARIKFYFPFRDRSKIRFMGNCDKNDLMGYDSLPPSGDLLIVTKSLKDVMAFDELGFNSVSVQAESMIFDNHIFEELKSRFPRIITLFDFDHAGVNLTNQFRKKFDTEYRFLTNGRFGTVDYHAKDISQYNSFNSNTIQLINNNL